jgi:hypothetical protein
MKKTVIFIQCGIALLMLAGCQKESKIDKERVLDMEISLQEKVLQKSSSNFLTVSLKNTSSDMVTVPESSFLLEFTSYSGSIRKTYYLDISGEALTATKVPQTSFVIKNEMVRSFDLKNIVTASFTDSELSLPADEYTVNLIMKTKADSRNSKNNKEIRSNYLDIQVKG